MRRFFRGQARRVVDRFLYPHIQVKADEDLEPDPSAPVTVPPAPEELLPDSEKGLLLLALTPFLLQAILQAGNLAGTLVGVPILVMHDPRVAEILKQAGTRIAGMEQTTLEAVRATLAEGVLRGYSARQIAYGVPEDGFLGLNSTVSETYKGRAELIARTEIVHARQLVALERYAEAGYNMIYVTDGFSCGWTTHNDPDTANGSVRTVTECSGWPLAHPSCQRVFLPYTEH